MIVGAVSRARCGGPARPRVPSSPLSTARAHFARCGSSTWSRPVTVARVLRGW
jgi:hypothetical protein